MTHPGPDAIGPQALFSALGGPEDPTAIFLRWRAAEGGLLAIVAAATGAFSAVGFMLRQFEIARPLRGGHRHVQTRFALLPAPIRRCSLSVLTLDLTAGLRGQHEFNFATEASVVARIYSAILSCSMQGFQAKNQWHP